MRDFEAIKQHFIEETFHSFLVEAECFFEYENQSDLLPPAAPVSMDLLVEEALDELVNIAKQSLSVGGYIREKAHQKDMLTFRPALFEEGQITRDYWSKLLNNEVNASKEKLLRVAVLLKLDIDEAEELLDKAGYAVSSSNPRDVVVTFCLNHRIYDFVVIEKLLTDREVQSLFNDRQRVK